MMNNESTRPRMQLTKPVQTANAGLVTPRATAPSGEGAPVFRRGEGLGTGPVNPTTAMPGGPQLPTTPSAPMSYLDIARNAIAQLTEDEVQMLLEEALNKQATPSAADMFNTMKGAQPLVK